MNTSIQFCCKDSSNHANKWYFSLPSNDKEIVCLACTVLTLEDKHVLNVRKKVYLCMLHDILHSSPQVIINVIQNEEEVMSHITMVLLSLCCGGVEILVKTASNCLLLFLIHAKKEELRLAVAQKLTVEIQQESNYVRCLPHFSLLGRLFQLFPVHISDFVIQNLPLIHFVARGLTHPSEDVRSTTVYIFLQLYSSTPSINKGVFETMDSFVAKGILYVLKSGLTKDVIKYGLALLKVFISQDSKRMSLLFENMNEDTNFMDVIKKIILTSDSAFQVCLIQCLCHIISESSTTDFYIRTLIEGNVPELLFEVISGTNELLLETILCCLHLFSRCSCFYEKCHVLYSVTTVIELAARLLNLKNMKLLCLTFNLLISLVSSDQYQTATSTQTSLFQQALVLIEKTYKVHNPHILLVVNKLLFYLLKKESFPSLKFPLPLSHLFCILNICLKNMQRFLSLQLLSTSQLKINFETSVESLPLEVKILTSGLDIIYLFIRIVKQHESNPISMEEIYSCPVIANDQSSKSTNKIDFQSLLPTFIAALDEIFVPSCLILDSSSFIGKISWCHLINALSAIFEDPIINPSLILFGQKLIKSRIFNHTWNIKVEEMFLFDSSFDGSTEICNRCLSNMLKFLLQTQQLHSASLNFVDGSINHMNCSIEECSSFLSAKPDSQNQHAERLYSIQSTFLSLVYFSYLYEGPIVNMKNLIPHLIYYVTCNLDRFNSTIIIVKHLIFILAVCMHENINKFQTGLLEVSGMMWDNLSKINSPEEVYTHHKVLLWWSFENQQVNQFSSYVLQVWLKFSENTTDAFLLHQAVKILVNLLSTNDVALETFVLQFESNPEIRFSFLRKVFESEVFNSEELILKERFEKIILSCVQHLQVKLSKLLIVKNHSDISEDSFLSVGLECLLWCQQKANTPVEVDTKLLFHVTSLCCNSSFCDKAVFVPSLRYLQYAVKVQTKDPKAWHIVTGNANIVTFFNNNLTMRGQFEIETLHLLILIVDHQMHANLKSNTCMRISLTQILKWMNCSETKELSLQLVNKLLDAEFKNVFIQICSLQQDTQLLGESLSKNDIRILALYLQNAIMLGNPIIENVALTSYEKLLKYIANTDSHLERHIMLQPWQRILLESRLEDVSGSRHLFEKWWNFNKENITLIGVMNQFAERILDMPDSESCKILNFGVYKKFMAKETISKLKEIEVSNSNNSNECTTETDMISEIENFVANHISSISHNPKLASK